MKNILESLDLESDYCETSISYMFTKISSAAAKKKPREFILPGLKKITPDRPAQVHPGYLTVGVKEPDGRF